MPINYEWTSFKKQRRRNPEYPSFEVSSHPLKANTVSMKESSSNNLIESLTKWSSAFEEVDPLMRFEQMDVNNSQDKDADEFEDNDVNYTSSWNTRRAGILNKYTTGEKLSIVSSFLPGGEKTLIRQVSNLNEKVKHRLEQLDEFDENSVRQTMGLSQQEYVAKINMLNDEIKKAWDTTQRVKAFKIGIQCSKLLSDVSVMQFYPSKFVLITDILDTFGNLVFDRLKEKSFGPNGGAVKDIDPSQVPESAKETCQNWLYKMASIRELLPRLYMEMSLLKCYLFLSKDEITSVLLRLSAMIRGIGNPLVATYLRLYLCRVASRLLGKASEEIFYINLKEFIEEYQQIFHPSMKKKYESQLITPEKYLSLYVPAIDWLLFGTLNSNRCKLTLIKDLLQQCNEIENSELLLTCLISAFDSQSINENASTILEMIQKSSDKMVLINEALTSLGEHLCSAPTSPRLGPEALTQTWWKITSNLKSPVHFLQVLEPWLQFACTHLSTQHVNIILRGTIRYMIKCGRPADEFSGHFQFVIKRMLKSIPDVEELFLMDAFMPLVELVQTTNARTLMAKTVLASFFSSYNSDYIEDHIVISSLMRLCCILHDSINAVTVEDELKLAADLISKFVRVARPPDDAERLLAFYVECRAAFIKLDAVLVALVHCVNKLGTRPGGSRWLHRACAAYSFVTVPSLHCTCTKAQLSLLNGQVALLNNCIGQAEANFKALIGLIPDIPEYILEDGQKKPTNVRVAGIISDLLSTLLILPDNLDSNCKAYILCGLIKTIEKIHWTKTEPLYYTTLLRILDLLCEMTRENYVHHIDSVISNDMLYGSDEEFVEAIDQYATNICQELLVVLKMLGDGKETKKQYNLALELFWRVARRGDLARPQMMSLANNLWRLSQKLQETDVKLAKSMLSTLEKEPSMKPLVQKILEQ